MVSSSSAQRTICLTKCFSKSGVQYCDDLCSICAPFQASHSTLGPRGSNDVSGSRAEDAEPQIAWSFLLQLLEAPLRTCPASLVRRFSAECAHPPSYNLCTSDASLVPGGVSCCGVGPCGAAASALSAPDRLFSSSALSMRAALLGVPCLPGAARRGAHGATGTKSQCDLHRLSYFSTKIHGWSVACAMASEPLQFSRLRSLVVRQCWRQHVQSYRLRRSRGHVAIIPETSNRFSFPFLVKSPLRCFIGSATAACASKRHVGETQSTVGVRFSRIQSP